MVQWLINLQKFYIFFHRGFQKQNEGKYEIKLKGPVLYLIGPYKVTGRVLILPIQGEGQSNMTLGMSILYTHRSNNLKIR